MKTRNEALSMDKYKVLHFLNYKFQNLKNDNENTEKMIMKTDDVKRARWSCRYVGK